MTRRPSVSVVIPTYAHRGFVAAAVRSALDQSWPPAEVIVVNDGSPDDTADVLRPFAASGAIRYVEQPNAGQAAARNRGLAAATGDLIAFLDDDDLWPADKLEWQIRALAADPSAGAVAGSAVLIDAGGGATGAAPVPNGPLTVEGILRSGNPLLSPGQVLIRADALASVGGLRASMWGADDYDLWLRLARQSRMIAVNRPALLYRRHAGNASRHAARLLANTERVIRRHIVHLPGLTRQAMRKEIYRGLYWWLGRQFVSELRAAVGRAEWAASATSLRALRPFGRAAIADPFLAKQVAADLLEPLFRRRRRRKT